MILTLENIVSNVFSDIQNILFNCHHVSKELIFSAVEYSTENNVFRCSCKNPITK